uniref:ANK_REP_REGION domain-containing protein n=1 Tax=Meloidogyne incognita TaxID=6306 RepID=A0A914N8H8_MELIC
MGNYISRYWSTSLPQPDITDSENLNGLDPNSNASKCFQNEQGSPEKLNSQIESDLPPTFVTPKIKRTNSKIFAAFVPDSPERYAFHNFNELKSFLDSPVGKRKGTRFKRCQDENDFDSFYNEQLSASTCTEDNNSSSSSIEQDLPYKEIPARRLTDFRVAIEKGDHVKFDELLSESPRFLVNTSNDLPTIIQIGNRYNALHVACRASNLVAVQKILTFICDKTWLTNAYSTDTCVIERSANLLDAMLNTPDKLQNYTPLHYACKMANFEIVDALLNFRVCKREPINKFANFS